MLFDLGCFRINFFYHGYFFATDSTDDSYWPISRYRRAADKVSKTLNLVTESLAQTYPWFDGLLRFSVTQVAAGDYDGCYNIFTFAVKPVWSQLLRTLIQTFF